MVFVYLRNIFVGFQEQLLLYVLIPAYFGKGAKLTTGTLCLGILSLKSVYVPNSYKFNTELQVLVYISL